jgi:hypothetical protein
VSGPQLESSVVVNSFDPNLARMPTVVEILLGAGALDIQHNGWNYLLSPWWQKPWWWILDRLSVL